MIAVVASLLLLPLMSATSPQRSTLSDLCTSQNEALATNEAILATTPSLLCHINLDVEDSCTVDFETVSDDFQDACFDAGGKVYLVDLSADCTLNLYGTTYNADYLYLNYPSCVGIDCTADELDSAYMSVVLPSFEQQFAETGFVCDFTDRNEEFPADSGGSTDRNEEFPADSGGSLFFSGTKTLALASVMVASAFLSL